MGRIGSLGCSYIFNPITGEKVPPYEEEKGYDGRQQIDDPIKARLMVVSAPSNFEGYIHYGGEQEETEKDIEHRLTIRHNKTDYEAKAPRRVEGLLFKQAVANPSINLSRPYEPDAKPMPLGDFNEEEQKYLRGDHIIDNLVIPETMNDLGARTIKKLTTPYERDVDDTVLDFIDKDGGRYYTSLYDHHDANESGSNVRADEFFRLNGGANQPVGDRSFESLYAQQNGDKTVSMVNFRQQDNFKAKANLGLYSGNPTSGNNRDDMIQKAVDREYALKHRRNRRNSESDEYEKAEKEYKIAEERLKKLRAKRQP
jgi:hypothetical protein